MSFSSNNGNNDYDVIDDDSGNFDINSLHDEDNNNNLNNNDWGVLALWAALEDDPRILRNSRHAHQLGFWRQ